MARVSVKQLQEQLNAMAAMVAGKTVAHATVAPTSAGWIAEAASSKPQAAPKPIPAAFAQAAGKSAPVAPAKRATATAVKTYAVSAVADPTYGAGVRVQKLFNGAPEWRRPNGKFLTVAEFQAVVRFALDNPALMDAQS